jgi:cellulose synthase/poly-beta-1,6-N-acetylglucosamine synthase-like glycosyltransferase
VSTLLPILVTSVSLLLLLPITVLFAEVVLAVTARRDPSLPELGQRAPSLAILMPAHDEASILAGTLKAIAPQLAASDRLLVVADNCTDETANIAAAEGAEVIVRNDLTRRGKGYALDFGIRHLQSDAPDIVVVIDADCRPAPGCIDRLVAVCMRTARPVQALYLMHAGADASTQMRIAEFAWLVKNQVRPLGLLRLGLPCQLMGTGMAFPWSCLSRVEIATGHIVEDLKLGIDLARAGTPSLFCPEALVTSPFPSSADGIRSQRTRWEHGHLGLILKEAPRMLCRAIASLDMDSLALGLDLIVPPLALIMLLAVATWALALILFLSTGAVLPLIIASAACAMFAFAVLAAWHSFGRHIISFRSLAGAVLRAGTKIPLYFRFVVARQSQWIRSKRDRDSR